MSAQPLAPAALELLVLQPTPFCNLDCSYCYLPDRTSKRRMSPETLDATLRFVFDSGLVRDEFMVLWHAGEPLVLPPSYYREAIAAIDRHNVLQVPIAHSFQTNAVLITQHWCEFFLEHDIHVGVSLDGPDFLHDRYRRTRRGGGTWKQVAEGIALLVAHEVPFDVLSVLTADALDYPDEMYDCYCELGARHVAFNVEEIEGPNIESTLQSRGSEVRLRRFFERFLDLAYATDPPLEVREFEIYRDALRHCHYPPGSRRQENAPWAILNVDCDGNFTTYSPELLGFRSEKHGEFALGNTGIDEFETVLRSGKFLVMEADIAAGVARCEFECEYFPYCGGGPPANKFFEHGTFAAAETLSCRLQLKACVDVTLARLEREVAIQADS